MDFDTYRDEQMHYDYMWDAIAADDVFLAPTDEDLAHDAYVLASAGWGTDEDYFDFGWDEAQEYTEPPF